jgi:MPBQ/MSBQ methyltransferase
MNSNLNALSGTVKGEFGTPVKSSSIGQIIEFYEEAGKDYEHWSTGFNMHLGFYRRGLNPFDREKMIEQSNLEIAKRLQISLDKKTFLIDLGCGTGAIARTIAEKYPGAAIKGVTLVPAQVELGQKLNGQRNLQRQIEIIEGDYTNLPFANGAADGVWAVESACHAEGADKKNLIYEMSRVLKRGGRFAVADCFIKQPQKKFNYLIKRSYRTVCECWALSEMPGLESFVEALERQGFQDIMVEDISWRVAPSLAHAPFAVLSFVLKKMLEGERLNQSSINNLKASLLALLLGLNRSKFSYCLISGRRG